MAGGSHDSHGGGGGGFATFIGYSVIFLFFVGLIWFVIASIYRAGQDSVRGPRDHYRVERSYDRGGGSAIDTYGPRPTDHDYEDRAVDIYGRRE